ncbi:MAG: hypothetical protein NZ809_05990 [Thermodesulfovibrio sp.]|nr:hypothetical protein [Thermodesulfovibrio sp.]
MTKKTKWFIFFLGAVCLVFIPSVSVYAHKVNTYAYREGNKISGECYFVDGSPCKNSKVEVYDEKGKKIFETVTDEKGQYSFLTEQRGQLKLVIFAGEGHTAIYKLEAVTEKRKEGITKRENQLKQKTSTKEDEIKQIVDEVIDTKIQGLRGEIADLRKKLDRVYLRDIIGGIGYIVGVWGLIMLFLRKRHAS